MHIASFCHKGLRQLYERGNPKGVQAASVDKLKKLLFAIEEAADIDELAISPRMAPTSAKGWPGRLLELGGDRQLALDFSV